jgi:hypothetical protein
MSWRRDSQAIGWDVIACFHIAKHIWNKKWDASCREPLRAPFHTNIVIVNAHKLLPIQRQLSVRLIKLLLSSTGGLDYTGPYSTGTWAIPVFASSWVEAIAYVKRQ